MTAATHQVLLVYLAYVVAAGSPGPSTMAIMGVAMAQGRRAALLLAGGVVTGSIVWGLTASMGVSTLLACYAGALVLLKIMGGLYLLFLALKAARSALAPDATVAGQATSGPPSSAIALYRRDLLMHLTNPKSVLAWIALVTLGLGPEASWRTAAAILGGCAVLGMAIFGGYALAFSAAPMVRAYRRARRWIEGALAVLFGAAGLHLLLSRT